MTKKFDKTTKIIIALIFIITTFLIVVILFSKTSPETDNTIISLEELEGKTKLNQIYYECEDVDTYNIYSLEGDYITTVRTIEEVDFYSETPDFDIGGTYEDLEMNDSYQNEDIYDNNQNIDINSNSQEQLN